MFEWEGKAITRFERDDLRPARQQPNASFQQRLANQRSRLAIVARRHSANSVGNAEGLIFFPPLPRGVWRNTRQEASSRLLIQLTPGPFELRSFCFEPSFESGFLFD